MNLVTASIAARIRQDIIANLQAGEARTAGKCCRDVVAAVHASIPEKKRISTGIYTCVKTVGEKIYQYAEEDGQEVFKLLATLYDHGEDEGPQAEVKGVALAGLSVYGRARSEEFSETLPFFLQGADSERWVLREYAQGLFRKLIKAQPEAAREFLLELTRSDSPNLRRFVSETLRPVQENRWFYKEPEYPISILWRLFREQASYPRTSVGNGLSDLSRKLPERVYSIVEELVASGDKNSYWIAYRACRNLVKTEPLRVMDLLQIDEYKYKTRVHRRVDYQ